MFVFLCSFLGVDNAVKVEYKDKGVTASTSGFLSKTATSTYKFVTTVKNTKATPIVITVADIFPRASDSRIKIKLIRYQSLHPGSSEIMCMHNFVAVHSPEQEELDAGTKAEDSRAAGRDTDEDSSMVGGSNTVAQNAITNNIVWNRTIPPQGKTTITLEYMCVCACHSRFLYLFLFSRFCVFLSVEYPMGEDIVIA